MYIHIYTYISYTHVYNDHATICILGVPESILYVSLNVTEKTWYCDTKRSGLAAHKYIQLRRITVVKETHCSTKRDPSLH